MIPVELDGRPWCEVRSVQKGSALGRGEMGVGPVSPVK